MRPKCLRTRLRPVNDCVIAVLVIRFSDSSHHVQAPPPAAPGSSGSATTYAVGAWPINSVRPLLQFYLRAGIFQFLLESLGVRLVHAFLDRLRCALDQVLGLLEAESGDRAHLLDHVDLVCAGLLQ